MEQIRGPGPGAARGRNTSAAWPPSSSRWQPICSSRLYAVRAVAGPEPPRFADLPEGLVSRFVGKHGCFAMQIYTKADIWNMDAMQQFVRQVRSVDPDVTGNPLQIYESSLRMKRSYEKGAVYGIIVVVLVVYLDFRNVRMTILALVPLVLSKLQFFGLMGWLEHPAEPGEHDRAAAGPGHRGG